MHDMPQISQNNKHNEEESKNDFVAYYKGFNSNKELLYNSINKISLNLEINGTFSVFEYSKYLYNK